MVDKIWQWKKTPGENIDIYLHLKKFKCDYFL